jgi:hypothetical protein
MTPAKLIKFKIRNEKIKKHFLMVMPLNKPMTFAEIANGLIAMEKDLEPEFQKFYSINRISACLNNMLVEQGIVKKEERIFTRIK